MVPPQLLYVEAHILSLTKTTKCVIDTIELRLSKRNAYFLKAKYDLNLFLI